MSSPPNSLSSSSESDGEESFDEEVVVLSEIVSYDDSLEPVATEEEAAEYEARMAREAEEERQFAVRFNREADVSIWYILSLKCIFGFTEKILVCFKLRRRIIIGVLRSTDSSVYFILLGY